MNQHTIYCKKMFMFKNKIKLEIWTKIHIYTSILTL